MLNVWYTATFRLRRFTYSCPERNYVQYTAEYIITWDVKSNGRRSDSFRRVGPLQQTEQHEKLNILRTASTVTAVWDF